MRGIKMIRLKATEKLFNRYEGIGIQVRGLSAIVQNDMEITDEEFYDWREKAIDTKNLLEELIEDTFEHGKFFGEWCNSIKVNSNANNS